MRRFITEVQKLDGTDFPPKTLYQIMICVLFHLKTLGFTWKLLDHKCFKEIRFTLDNVMKACTSAGIDVAVRKSEVLSKMDEDILWSSEGLGTETPEKLLHTVLFVPGLNCTLCTGREHRKLRSMPFNSLFTWIYDNDGVNFLRYREDIGAKTN